MKKNTDFIDKYPREFWEEQIKRWVKCEKARYCLTRSLLDRTTYEQIAEEIGLTTNTVYLKIKKYENIMLDNVIQELKI